VHLPLNAIHLSPVSLVNTPKRNAMGLNDHSDDDGYGAFLQELLDGEPLEKSAAGITELVIEKGVDSLSDKQRGVFERYVLKEYVTEECTRCHSDIPWSEMYGASGNGGACSWCAKMESNDD